MFSPLSVAAACNSKLNERQKRLRSASPQALLMRPPKGAWMMSCIPPPSSKKRSAMMQSCVGTSVNTARPVTMYSISCSAPESSSPHSSFSHATAYCTSGLDSMPRRRVLGAAEGDVSPAEAGSRREEEAPVDAALKRRTTRAVFGGGFLFPHPAVGEVG